MTKRIRHLAVVIGMMGAWAPGWVPGLADVDIVQRVQADDSATPATTLEQYCRSWARNAMMGANVQRRGGRREITYIDENQLRYLIKHQVSGDNLYMLKAERSPAEKRYLEESLLAGYDRMDKWASEHGKDAIDIANWEADAFADCMKDVPDAIRKLLDSQ
ncbi:MAG: hypothetical protein ABI728_08580 [Betaproteobacteria bacterium]